MKALFDIIAGAKVRIICGAIAVAVLVTLGLATANHFENIGRTAAAGEWSPKLAAVNAQLAVERIGWAKKDAAERATDLALERKHQADMQDLRDHQQLIERQTSEKHETELAQLRRDRDADRRRADAAGGLRIAAPGAPACAPGSAVAGPEAAGTGGRDEPASTGTVRLPERIENDLWAAADAADEVSAQLRACQGWIRANGFYGSKDAETSALPYGTIAAPNQSSEGSP